MTVFDIDRSFLGYVDLRSLIEQRSPTRFGKPSGNGSKRTAKGPCPWCGGTDRFAVFTNEIPQRYYCGIHGNGCHKQGDAIRFLRDYEGRSFKDAYAILQGEDIPQVNPSQQERSTSTDDWQSKLWQEKAAQFCKDAENRLWGDEAIGFDVLTYLLDRGFTEETIKAAHLGAVLYYGAPSLVIPWYDLKHDRYWRVNLRDIRPGIDPKKRYKNLPDSSVSDGIYGSQVFNRPVFLVEGELDALSIAQEAGDLVAVIATGSTGGSRNPLWALKLATAPRVFVAFDAQANAEKSARYWLNALSNAIRWRTPGGKDANDLLQREISIRLWVESALATLSQPEPEPEPEPEPQSLSITSEAQFMAVVQQIGDAVSQDTQQDWTISVLPKGWTLHDYTEYLYPKEEKPKTVWDWIAKTHGDTPDISPVNWEEDRAAWAAIRERRAYTGIPRWLIPGTEDWNKQVERNGVREMMERRQAWFDQQQRLNDVVPAAER